MKHKFIFTSLWVLGLLTTSFAGPSAQAIWSNALFRFAAQQRGLCTDFLSKGPYSRATSYIESHDQPPLSLTPEPDSIESRSPGTIAELVRLRSAVVKESKSLTTPNLTDETVRITVGRFTRALQGIQDRHADPQLKQILENLAKHFWQRTERVLRSPQPGAIATIPRLFQNFRASLWEVIVACLFAGDEILLNQQVSQVFPEAFQSGPPISARARRERDREIDIMIKRHDGSWRWIEVKDWDRKTSQDPVTQLKAIDQSIAQNELRKLIQDPVEMILVLKYGLPEMDFIFYKTLAQADQIYFVFPSGSFFP